jgi:hypothetical protein
MDKLPLSVACVAMAAVPAQARPPDAPAGSALQDCGACEPAINDSQVGIGGGFYQECRDGSWVSLAFPIQTGGANIDTVVSVFNSNDGEGDIYITGGTCNGPDVTDIKWVCCNGIKNAPPGVPISNSTGFPITTSATDPTWVVMVPRSGGSFYIALDSSTLGTSGAAYGNLTGLGIPGDWQDLNLYGFGACYWVDLTVTGNPASPCGGGPAPANDDCANAAALDVAPGGVAFVDGTTMGAAIDDAECVTPTTAPGVWYMVTGNGNTMTATTCEDFPPAGADYDTKISVFCGDCPSPLSSCCSSRDGSGCDEPNCETIVCAQDSFCCSVRWDSLCASQARTKCGDVCFPEGGSEPICIAGNDDDCGAEYLHSTVTWCAGEGTVYRILVHGFGGNTGDFTLVVSDEGQACAPHPCVELVGALDIKPGSCPNAYNHKGTGNGTLPVALVGTDELDATMVDSDSLLLYRADGVGGAVAPLTGPPGPGITIADTATPFAGELCACHDQEGDGIADLNLKFDRTTMTDVLELDDLPGCAFVELELSGTLLDGTEFAATDCIRLVPPGDIGGDCAVGVADFLVMLATWGSCPAGPADCAADLDGSGDVGVTDLLILLASWG